MSRLDTAVEAFHRQRVDRQFSFVSYYRLHKDGFISEQSFDKFFFKARIKQFRIAKYLREISLL